MTTEPQTEYGRGYRDGLHRGGSLALDNLLALVDAHIATLDDDPNATGPTWIGLQGYIRDMWAWVLEASDDA